MNYQEASKLPRSEKITLVTAEASQEVKLFTIESGEVYSRDVNYFVVGVKDGSVNLTKEDSESLSAGSFYFNPKTKKLFVRMANGSDPKTRRVSILYRFFWSDASIVLPYDLNNGEDVEWDGRVISTGALGQKLDDENTGIVLESSSSITLENTDGEFDSVFDTLIWEHKAVKFYSWLPNTSITEAKKIFEGVIESKDFDSSKISFKVKDFVFKLKNQVNLSLFSDMDGSISPSILGTPKRRLYGMFKQLKCVGIDNILGGVNLSGSVSLTSTSETLSGSGTSFLSEASPGDEIFITDGNEVYKFGVESIESNTSLTLSKKADVSTTGSMASIIPEIALPAKNRKWHIAGHKLREPTTVIDFVYSSNRLRVESVQDLYPGDSVKINDEYVTIRRISGRQIVLNNALSPKPLVGDTLSRNPVSKLFFGSEELFIDRDWTLVNDLNGAYIELSNDAEKNVAEPKSVGVNLVFTNGSRTLTTSAVVDLRTILKPRDWIRKNNIGDTNYYEILEVKEQSIILRTSYLGTSATSSALMKNLNIVNDESLITVNCMGLEVDGGWIKTPSQAVRHLILNDAGFSSVNEGSFNTAKEECDFILSLAIPENIGSASPSISETITKINESVFGSLYGDSSWDISYSILNSKKPETLETIRDDDILSFGVTSEQKIINSIKINYRPFTDIYNGNDAFEVYQKTSDFVDRMMGILNSEERTIYLYEDDKAQIIGQRILFFRSLSNCKVTVTAKMNLSTTSVNDKIYLELDRMYRRYGGRDKRKIGVVVGIKKNGTETTVDFIDLGGIYNRVPSIAPNNTPDYSSSTREDVIRYGYCVDNDTLTPNILSELELGNNLIG